jgi:Condensation domain
VPESLESALAQCDSDRSDERFATFIRSQGVPINLKFGDPMERVDTSCELTSSLVRSVDALERLFYRYGERHPDHFLIVAEFDEVLDVERLSLALAAVQHRHPLLSVHVEDRPDGRLGFYRKASVAPIELTVLSRSQWCWQTAAAAELGRKFDRSRAPLMRACVVLGAASSALLLTFDHVIADGISSVMVLDDVVAALNGAALAELAVPPSQEQLIERMLSGVAVSDPSDGGEDPRMRTPKTNRAFDGAMTNVHALAMTAADTARLVRRCRAEQTTVHAALVTAMCRVRAEEVDEDYVRVLHPINFRKLIEVEGDCAPYFQSTWTGLAPADGRPFWDQARAITAHLQVARSAAGIRAASLAVQEAIGPDAEAGDAEELFVQVCPFEMIVTNLGVQELNSGGRLRPTAVWGPIVQAHVDGEYVTGITTYGGRLRMTTCGYSAPSTFLKDVAIVLSTAVNAT